MKLLPIFMPLQCVYT